MRNRDLELEVEIRALPSVMEAAVFTDASKYPIEIQVWTEAGSSEREVRTAIADLLAARQVLQYNERTYVFELSGEVIPPEQKTPVGQATVSPLQVVPAEGIKAEEKTGGRPRIGKISVSATESDSHANVSLIYGGRESEGVGKGRKTQYALQVTAATTLEAAQALLGTGGVFTLKGATLVETLGYSAVLVILETQLGGGRTLIGASLVRDSEVPQATVKATLDAVNRQLELALAER